MNSESLKPCWNSGSPIDAFLYVYSDTLDHQDHIDSLQEFLDNATEILKWSPHCSVHFLHHKSDLLKNHDDEDALKQQVERLKFPTHYWFTSIWDSSLYKVKLDTIGPLISSSL